MCGLRGAFVYLIIKQEGKTLYNSRSTFFQNASTGISWNTTFSLIGLDIFKPIEVQIWDYDDFDADDYMGGVEGPIYSITNKYNESINFDCSNCTIGYTIAVVYQ